MKSKHHFVLLLVSLVLSLTIVGCHPNDELSLEELDIIVTEPRENTDFSNYQTYSMPNVVVKIKEDGADNNNPGSFDTQMLSLVRENMSELGYTEEENPADNPSDVVVLIAAQETENYFYQDDYPLWDWWGWWIGWFGGWSIGAGWEGTYGDFFSSSYTTGTIFIVMIDPNQPNTSEQEIPIVWSATLNGLVRGSDSRLESRIRRSINQAFDQSNYLRTN